MSLIVFDTSSDYK